MSLFGFSSSLSMWRLEILYGRNFFFVYIIPSSLSSVLNGFSYISLLMLFLLILFTTASRCNRITLCEQDDYIYRVYCNEENFIFLSSYLSFVFIYFVFPLSLCLSVCLSVWLTDCLFLSRPSKFLWVNENVCEYGKMVVLVTVQTTSTTWNPNMLLFWSGLCVSECVAVSCFFSELFYFAFYSHGTFYP